MLMYSIETPENWWSLVDLNWGELLKLLLWDLEDHGKLVVRSPTAAKGYQACKIDYSNCETDVGLCNNPEFSPEGDLVIQAQTAKSARDHETLLTLFNRAWAAAPDHQNIHRRPAWGVLCDLCSENWVFDQN